MERLQDNQQVKRYVEQLQGHDRMVEARECQYLMEQIDHLEWQLGMMGKELKNLRRQLGKAERGTPQRRMKAVVRRTENVVKEVKGYIREIKRSIVSGMRKAVRNVKKKGASALDTALDKLYIRVMLRNISMGMERASANMRETINRIAAASEESQKTKIHKRNISRALFGKGREEVPETFELGVAARNVVRPFEIVNGLCSEIGKQVERLEGRMERLSRRVELEKGQKVHGQEGVEANRALRPRNVEQLGIQRVQEEDIKRKQSIRKIQEYTKSCRQTGQNRIRMVKERADRYC